MPTAEKIFLGLLLLLVFFLSIYKLTESPPVWFDEGFIIQSAINLAETGEMGIQIAPGKIIGRPEIFSTGWPVTYPVGLVMKFFGQGLLQARAVMVFFLMALVLFFYLLAKKIWGFKIAVFSSLLLASFAPFYGNGKNVLGEVPGLFFLILFLFFINKLERNNFKNNFYHYALAGLAAGLCVSTKSIFLLLLPAMLLTLILFRRNIVFKLKPVLVSLLFFFLPVGLWLKTQFAGIDSISSLFSTYSNPYALGSIGAVVIENLRRFFTETTPIYFLILAVVWIVSIILRIRTKKQKISVTEVFSFIFVVLVWLAYFRTAGWYRYFFPASVAALLYFPMAFYTLFSAQGGPALSWDFLGKRVYKLIPAILLSVLISIQFYQVGFSSWVATYYQSVRTKELTEYFNGRDNSKSLFVYRNPEIVPFVQSRNYYQYLRLTDALSAGEDELDKINSGVPDEIIMTVDEAEKPNEKISGLFLRYQEKDRVGKYVILEKKH